MSKDRVGSLIFLFAGIFGLVFSTTMPLGSWNRLGPGAFPLSLSILLCIFGIVWFILGKREGKGIHWREFIKHPGIPSQIVLTTAACILALKWAGFLLTATLYLFVLFLLVCRYRLWVATVLALSLGAGSWLFFEKFLDAHLPRGLLPL
jgi:hypothetical protein